MGRRTSRGAQPIIKTCLTFATILSFPFIASPQVSPKSEFMIHISKIKRVNEGCTVDAESATVRFKISSELSAPCGMLRAGETYKGYRATAQKDPKDETKDSTILVIYNNVKNARRDNAVFTINSEEAITRK
jgi:hypothetical protein